MFEIVFRKVIDCGFCITSDCPGVFAVIPGVLPRLYVSGGSRGSTPLEEMADAVHDSRN